MKKSSEGLTLLLLLLLLLLLIPPFSGAKCRVQGCLLHIYIRIIGRRVDRGCVLMSWTVCLQTQIRTCHHLVVGGGGVPLVHLLMLVLLVDAHLTFICIFTSILVAVLDLNAIVVLVICWCCQSWLGGVIPGYH